MMQEFKKVPPPPPPPYISPSTLCAAHFDLFDAFFNRLAACAAPALQIFQIAKGGKGLPIGGCTKSCMSSINEHFMRLTTRLCCFPFPQDASTLSNARYWCGIFRTGVPHCALIQGIRSTPIAHPHPTRVHAWSTLSLHYVLQIGEAEVFGIPVEIFWKVKVDVCIPGTCPQ